MNLASEHVFIREFGSFLHIHRLSDWGSDSGSPQNIHSSISISVFLKSRTRWTPSQRKSLVAAAFAKHTIDKDEHVAEADRVEARQTLSA